MLVAPAIACCLAPSAANAARAGTDIVNTAQVAATLDGVPLSQSSNTVRIRLGELLDVGLVANSTAPEAVRPGETGHVSSFVLTNAGNGEEAFAPVATIAGIDGTISAIRVDGNGNGRFDADADPVLGPGGTTPIVAPGSSLFLFVVSDFASSTETSSNGTLAVTAAASTGSGAPGADYPEAGDGGSDAVVGATTAAATAEIRLVGADSGVTLTKSQVVTNPGAGGPGRGSIITYRLDARFTAAPVTDARLADAIPAGTTYLPGSLRLDDTTLSDAADADPGAFDPVGKAISVRLGDSAAATTRSITFQVQIN